MRVTGSAPLVGAVSELVANLELEPLLNTEPCSSSHSESIRDVRRPVDDDDELRREADDKLAIRPKARMAVPVFYPFIPHTRTHKRKRGGEGVKRWTCITQKNKIKINEFIDVLRANMQMKTTTHRWNLKNAFKFKRGEMRV